METTEVALSGEIDIATVPAVRERLTSAIDANPGATLRIDLSDVEFIDSTGLGILVGALRRSRSENGDLVLLGLRPHVQKLFEITGLERVFTVEG